MFSGHTVLHWLCTVACWTDSMFCCDFVADSIFCRECVDDSVIGCIWEGDSIYCNDYEGDSIFCDDCLADSMLCINCLADSIFYERFNILRKIQYFAKSYAMRFNISERFLTHGFNSLQILDSDSILVKFNNYRSYGTCMCQSVCHTLSSRLIMWELELSVLWYHVCAIFCACVCEVLAAELSNAAFSSSTWYRLSASSSRLRWSVSWYSWHVRRIAYTDSTRNTWFYYCQVLAA